MWLTSHVHPVQTVVLLSTVPYALVQMATLEHHKPSVPCVSFGKLNPLCNIYRVAPSFFVHSISYLACFHFSAPQPECTSDPECPLSLACINQECKDPCFKHVCGINADCKVKRHRPICFCLPGFVGNPNQICEERKHLLLNLH